MKIALISPTRDAYSETFIKAHKEMLDGEVFYFYGGSPPTHLDHIGSLVETSGVEKLANRFYAKLLLLMGHKNVSLREIVFKKALNKTGTEVVLAEYGTTGAKIFPTCKALNIPLVVHFHGYDAAKYEIINRYQIRYNELFQYASFIISVSEQMSRKLRELGCPEEKIVQNTYGPNDAFLKVFPSFSEQAFAAVGRFVDKKAPYYSILAFQKVLETHPNAKLYMAGDGPLRNTCENIVKYLGLNENIEFLGIISPSQYMDLLTRVRGFVQHSIKAADGDMEGTPVAILEASAAGVPVVSTYHAGISEVIQDGVSGFLVNEHDVNGMAGYMSQLLNDKEMAKQMGKYGKRWVQENYSLERHISLLNEILKQATNGTA